MEDLNEQQIQILRWLTDQTDPLSGPILARRSLFAQNGSARFQTHRNPGGDDGIYAEPATDGNCPDLRRRKPEPAAPLDRWADRLSAGDSVLARRQRIYLDLLLKAPRPMTIRRLSETYYVGSGSIVNDLAAIEARIRGVGLTLNRTREGTYITGDELTIRNRIADVLNQIHHFDLQPQSELPSRLNAENRMVLSGIYGPQSLRQVEQCVGEIEDAIGVILGDIYYINIVTHILIAMERMRSRRYINRRRDGSQADQSADLSEESKSASSVFPKRLRFRFP